MKHKQQTNTVRKLLGNLPRQQLALLLVLVAVVAIGIGLMFASHAATPVANVESESGTVTSPASVVSDNAASGGSAVKFGSAGSGVPAQCASGGTFLWSNLETCGWPGPANTGPVASSCPGGVLAATTLTPDSHGVITISQNNTTINCQTINGCVVVNATGVTLTNDLVNACNGRLLSGEPIEDGDSQADGTGAVLVNDNATATISHDELNGNDQVHACVWDGGNSLSVSAINCHSIDDGIFSWGEQGGDPASAGDNLTISNSYFHDFTTKTSNGHIDGYQTEGASNITINHNTYLMTSDATNNGTDSAVATWDSNKSTSNILVENNLITGGGAAIYAEDYNGTGTVLDGNDSGAPGSTSPAGGFSVTNVYYVNNDFSSHLFGDCVGAFFIWFYRGPGEGSSLTWPPYYGGPTDVSLTPTPTGTSNNWNPPPSTTNPIPVGYPSFREGNTVLETGQNVDNGNPTTNGKTGGPLCT